VLLLLLLVLLLLLLLLPSRTYMPCCGMLQLLRTGPVPATATPPQVSTAIQTKHML
jgi:hypothetical protein